MRLGLLTEWYDPEPGPAALPGALARGLVARGHEVHVLTGFPNYPTGEVFPGYRVQRRTDDLVDGVHVRRVALYPSHGRSAVKRFATYGSFGLSALVNGLSALRGLDAIWVNYSPITVAWPMWAAQLAFRVPTVVHVLDLWPDTVLASGFASGGAGYRAAAAVMNPWCNAMYRSAATVAYIAPGVGGVLERRGVSREKLRYVPMWAEESVFHPSDSSMRRDLGIDEDAIVLLYAGTLGEAQGLDSLVDACRRVTDSRFACVIAGSGTTERRLRERAEDVENVRFIGRVPQESMTRLMATCDISYVGLRSHPLSHVTMPSKIQAGLAAGRALLIAADGDAPGVVSDSGAGFSADPSDPESIASAIDEACALGREGLRTMGARAREYYLETFSLDRGVGTIEKLLAEAAAERTGAR